MKSNRNDLTPYMPPLPASAADLKPSKALTIIDRADRMLDDNDVFDVVKAGEEKCNGYGPTSTTAMFSRAFVAQNLINAAKESGDEIMGGLIPEEMDRALTFAKRRRGFSLRQRRRLAIANRQKAIADQAAGRPHSEIPVAFK